MSLRMSSVLLCRIGLREEDERDPGKPDAAYEISRSSMRRRYEACSAGLRESSIARS
jgi:hypothetical protein